MNATKTFILPSLLLMLFLLPSCGKKGQEETTTAGDTRKYALERVGPARVVQLYADGFDQLTPKEKIFAYYISQAAIAGRDIAIDQHHPDALEVRDLFEQVYLHPAGIDSTVKQKLTEYLKLFWINNGFYDNLTSKKFVPAVTVDEFRDAAAKAAANGADFILGMETLDRKIDRLKGIIFDPAVDPVMTEKSPGKDWIRGSGVNFYGRGITYAEVEKWAAAGKEKYPLNSKVVKENGRLVEKVWRAGGDGVPPGMYAPQLEAVIANLEAAIPYAASDAQQQTVRLLVRFLRTGDPGDFRKYNIHWVSDSSNVDFILGFIEGYLDPRGQKSEFEASVYYTDPEQTHLMRKLATYAQYFENKAPWAEAYRKQIEQVPIANVINVMTQTGGTGPVSPIGINLPNEQAIRELYGSKSVLLHNIVDAYDKSSGKDLLKEFAYDQAEIDNQEKYGTIADNLHTAMHEVIGHASGKVSEKLGGKDPADFFPGYYNTLEEARADLVALWNVWDEKLVEIGIAKNPDEAKKIGETMYQQSVRVAVNQLRRIGGDTQIEEDHMKNRQLIVHYIMKNSDAVVSEKRDGKTYYRITSYEKMRAAVGKLLAEIMRIKAEGDFKAAKELIDTYGLKVDVALRDEVQERVRSLDTPAYTGFVEPVLTPVMDPEGKIVDVKVSYPLSLPDQMLSWSATTRKMTAPAEGRR
jgi:dipeptidyl-peptidase III